jgi:hypothetical protein
LRERHFDTAQRVLELAQAASTDLRRLCRGRKQR